MCKNHLILYIFLLIMVNLHTANAHHELEDQNIVNGEENYQAHCASCHGVDLEGQPNWRTMKADGSLPAPPHDETGHTGIMIQKCYLIILNMAVKKRWLP